jgi:hypothetical protein
MEAVLCVKTDRSVRGSRIAGSLTDDYRSICSKWYRVIYTVHQLYDEKFSSLIDFILAHVLHLSKCSILLSGFSLDLNSTASIIYSVLGQALLSLISMKTLSFQ